MYYNDNIATLCLSGELNLIINTFEKNENFTITFNRADINDYLHFFKPCFENENLHFCSRFVRHPIYGSEPVHAVICSKLFNIGRALTVCIDVNNNLNSAFGNRLILYPNFLYRLYIFLQYFSRK